MQIIGLSRTTSPRCALQRSQREVLPIKPSHTFVPINFWSNQCALLKASQACVSGPVGAIFRPLPAFG
jgi:hypothetical protein